MDFGYDYRLSKDVGMAHLYQIACKIKEGMIMMIIHFEYHFSLPSLEHLMRMRKVQLQIDESDKNNIHCREHPT